MKHYIDSPIYHALCGIFDLVILNLSYLACCIPFVTMGAATSALYLSVYHMHQGEGSLVRRFFRSFYHTLRRSIPIWLLWIAALLILCADFTIIGLLWNFSGKYILLGILGFCGLILFLFGSCLFPILCLNPDNKYVLKFAFRSCLQYLPRMIPVCFLNLLPILLLVFWPYGFLLVLVFLIFIWFSLTAYINVIFLKPIMHQIESRG